MIIYVESNFVLELALLQEEHASCESVMQLCGSGRAQLVIPAYSLAEPYEALGRRQGQRKQLKRELDQVVVQLRRTSPYMERVEDFNKLTQLLLIDSADEDARRLESVRGRILDVAEVIPLDAEVLRSGTLYHQRHDLTPQDAVVFASVIRHLDRNQPMPSCFLNKNQKDFDDPDLVEELKQRNCKMLPKFTSGIEYIQSQLR